MERGNDAEFQKFKNAAIRFQKDASPVYRAFHGYEYLPVEAFELTDVGCFDVSLAERVFKSSGTGGSTRARHFIKDVSIYERSIRKGFEIVFGSGPFILLGHLPAYRTDSSLVYMVNYLIESFGVPGSGLFLDDDSVLHTAIDISSTSGTPLFLFGAAFGLLDLIRNTPITLPPGAMVIETGGMKTHRREISRSELHDRLAHGFKVRRRNVRSEYGMCELLSQCYTNDSGLFEPPPWMRCETVDIENPGRTCSIDEPGALAVFDLANIYSQCAILTQDRAVKRSQGFEVLGRMNDAELRGCNFLLGK